jgi:hypothetical protein
MFLKIKKSRYVYSQGTRAPLRPILAVGMLLVVSGCSLGGLFGGRQDDSVLNTTSYRKVNFDCSFKADSPELDVNTFRSVLKCFNANHALDRLEALVQSLPDDKLWPIVRISNQYIMTHKKRLYEFQSTYDLLKEAKPVGNEGKKGDSLLDESIKQFGKLLENGEFISSLLALLKDGVLVDARTVDPNASAGTKVPDPDLLKAIELISEGFTPSNMNKALKMGLNISSADSFQDLHAGFKKGLKRVSSLQGLVDGVFYYIKGKHTYKCDAAHPKEEIRKELFDLISTGELSATFEKMFSLDAVTYSDKKSDDPLKDRISSISLLLKAMTSDPGHGGDELIKKLGAAFNQLSDPITCMKQGVSISNPSLLMIKEMVETYNSNRADASSHLARYVLQENPLNFMGLQPICSLPDGLQDHYGTLRDLALTGYRESSTAEKKPLILPMADLLTTVYENSKRPWKGCDSRTPSAAGDEYHPMSSFMVHLLGDIDSQLGSKGKGLSSSKKGLDFLIPVLSEISRQDGWTNLLLVTTLAGKEDREQLNELARYLVQPQKKLAGKAIADVIIATMERSKSVSHLYTLVKSLSNYNNLEDDFLYKRLLTLHAAYHSTDKHIFVQLLQEIMADARKNSDLFDSVFYMAGTYKGKETGKEKDYLSEAIAEIAEMAEDGRLRELMDAVVSINRKFAEAGKENGKVLKRSVPLFVAKRRHNFRSSDIQKYSLSASPLKLSQFNLDEDCAKLDFSVSLVNSSGPAFEQQTKYFLNCLNSDGKHGEIAKAVDFLQARKLVSTSSKSLFDLQVDLFTRSTRNFTKDDFGILIQNWIAYYDDRSTPHNLFHSVLNSIPMWVKGVAAGPGIKRDLVGPILKPLLSVLGSVLTNARDEIRKLTGYIADVMKKPDFSLLLEDLDDILLKKDSQTPPTPNLSALRNAELNPSGDPFVDRILNTAWNGPVDRPFNDAFINRIKQWIIHKECVDSTNTAELEARVARVLNDARDRVNDWELRPGREGKLEALTRWEFRDLKPWLEPVVAKLAEPRLSHPDRSVLDAQLNFFQYFSLPTHQATYRSRGELHPQFTPEWLANWFYDRAIDFQPITLYYEDGASFGHTPRVEIVNTLTRFVLVTYYADTLSPFPISKNLGLRNLAVLGDAWGDIADPHHWPKEIRDQFYRSRVRPKTILEAVQEIKSPTLSLLDPSTWVGMEGLAYYMVGLPTLPACHQNVPGEKPDPQSNRYVGAAFGHDLKARLYNILQVIDVMEENAPGGSIPGSPQTGLEFFRNLFFELHYSTPDGSRGFYDDIVLGNARNNLLGETNNLTVISYSNKIGLLSQIGRLIQNVPRNDPALKDFFYTLVRSSKSPIFKQVMVSLVSTREGQEVFWNVLRSMIKVVNKKDVEATQRLKTISYYLVAAMNQLDPWTPPRKTMSPATLARYRSLSPSDFLALDIAPEGLLDLLLKRVKEINTDDNLRNFLGTHTNPLFQDLMVSKTLASFAENAYLKSNVKRAARLKSFLEDFAADPARGVPSHMKNGMEVLKALYKDATTQHEWWLTLQKMDALAESQPFKDLNLDRAVRPLLMFLEKTDLDHSGVTRSQSEKNLADKFLVNASDLIRSQDLNEFLLYAHEKPDEVDQILETLSEAIGSGDQGELKDFFNRVHGRLSAPKH